MASREVLVVGRNLRAAFALAGPSGVAEAIAAFVGDDGQKAEGLLEEGFGGAAHVVSPSQVYAPAPPVPR